MTSTVSVRGQTSTQVAIRKRYNIMVQICLEWINDGHGITVVPVLRNPVKALRGRLKGVNLAGPLSALRQEERAHAS